MTQKNAVLIYFAAEAWNHKLTVKESFQMPSNYPSISPHSALYNRVTDTDTVVMQPAQQALHFLYTTGTCHFLRNA